MVRGTAAQHHRQTSRSTSKRFLKTRIQNNLHSSSCTVYQSQFNSAEVVVYRWYSSSSSIYIINPEYGETKAPAIQNCKRISHAAQLLLHLANNTARTQIHNFLCQECGGCRQGYGRTEVHSFLLQIREGTLAARSQVLKMLEVKYGRWFGMLDDDSPKVKWMRRVYPRVDYTQAPWPLLRLGSRAKASTRQGRHRRFTGSSAFHMYFRGLLSLLATQQNWYHHLQQVAQSLIPHKTTTVNIGVPSKLHVPHTHTPVL